jgi:predicted transposase/invertase (TIGR01784 family)
MVYFSPKVDLVFRKLFGSEENKDLLIALINSIVGPRLVIADLIVKNPYNLADYLGARESILDIKAVDQNGKWYDIEMQIAPQVHYGRRALYYLSKVYADQLGEGDGFDNLHETIGIHFLDFDYFAGDRYVRQFFYKDEETDEYHEERGYHRLYFVEMRKFRKEWNELTTALDRWVSFMNHAEMLGRSSIPSELAVDTAIVKAVDQLERIGFDPDEREIYERTVQAKMVDAATLEWAEQRGEQRGKESLLLRQITKRFGPASTDLVTRLDRLSADQLDELAEAILDLNDSSDLDTWITSRLPA